MPTETIKLPEEPIGRLLRPIERFMHVQAASGVVLLACAVIALFLANSGFSEGFLGFWKTRVGFTIGSLEMVHSLKHWINDGLMAIFFFVIGLEVKRELVVGELREMRRAALPIAAALGGMIVPAGIYLVLQWRDPGQNGWGIPMATDIAFVVGCMAVLGKRVPHSLRVLLLSLAIADDIGAILVIAIGYSKGFDGTMLLLAFVGLGVVLGLRWIGVRNLLVYVLVGTLVWFCFHESGVHATIAGVLLGLLTPTSKWISPGLFGDVLVRAKDVFEGEGWETDAHRAAKIRAMQRVTREAVSPLEYLETTLHPWVGFLIMPIFALANAGVPLTPSYLSDPIAMAVAAGLVVGKPVGIVLFSWIAIRAGLARLPDGIDWSVVLGAGCLAGIGFTMALFIAELALPEELLYPAKVGVLGGSLLAAVAGMAILLWRLPKRTRAATVFRRRDA